MPAAPVTYLCKSSALTGLADLQMYPPGKQTIIPSSPDPKKKPQPIEVTIDAATADALEAVRAEYQAKADAGEGDAPFIDFNHDDREAAAWPKRIYWAGEDPVLGGVRAEVEWTSAGEEAVQGKTFRRFSPAFYKPGQDGRITGCPVNMGGLVNRAAFTHIAPLFAKEGDATPADDATSPTTQESTTTPSMNPEEIAALQDENAKLKTELEALQAQNTELCAKVDEMSVAAKAAAEADAKNTVACAAKDGRIPPAEEIQAKWVAAIVADPSAKELLLAMAPNPALQTVVQAKAAPADPEKETVAAKSGLDAVADAIKSARSSKDR